MEGGKKLVSLCCGGGIEVGGLVIVESLLLTSGKRLALRGLGMIVGNRCFLFGIEVGGVLVVLGFGAVVVVVAFLGFEASGT